MLQQDSTLGATAASIAEAFEINGSIVSVAALGDGLIHDTLAIRTAGCGSPQRYVLQRLNQRVFTAPLEVMHNIECVTAHLRAGLEADGSGEVSRRCLRLVPARDGKSYAIDPAGSVWRVYHYIEGSLALGRAPTSAQAWQAAWGFGNFIARLADLDPTLLHETLPGFHDLDARLDALTAASQQQGTASVEAELRHANERHRQIRQAIDSVGALPRRVVHNDCKLNNVLLDAATGGALCVIDLDTVMEGNLLADFGDLVRTAATPAAEDERDLTRVTFDLERFAALASGYLSGLDGALTPAEQQVLPLAGPTLALENALRFLTDHLAGDVYFAIEHEGHNLDRARCQLRLCDAMLAGLQEARALVDNAAASLDNPTEG